MRPLILTAGDADHWHAAECALLTVRLRNYRRELSPFAVAVVVSAVHASPRMTSQLTQEEEKAMHILMDCVAQCHRRRSEKEPLTLDDSQSMTFLLSITPRSKPCAV